MKAVARSLLVTVALAAACSGCRMAKVGARAFGPLFSSPAKVKKAKPVVADDARLAMVWVGHSTAVLQIGKKVILTDPVFTDTVGQLAKRLVEPGIDVDDLPPIDAVVVSHVHYDHLSLRSLSQIEGRVRTLVLPSGASAYTTDFRFPTVELRPHQAWEKDGLRITAEPVVHQGWRYGADLGWADTAFTGYVIEHEGVKVYFGGDTAYDPALFLDTAQRHPGLDLALLPIAPMEPRSFMRKTHVDADEALQAFFDLDARVMVPIHHSTFVQGDDPPGEPMRRLLAKRATYGAPGRVVVPMAVGERRVFLKKGEVLPPVPSLERPATPLEVSAPPPPAKKVEQDENDEEGGSIPDDDRLD